MAETGLLTVIEAADTLHLKPSTIRAWILHRRIPHVKLGGRVFIRRNDCEALIAASVVPAREDHKSAIRVEGVSTRLREHSHCPFYVAAPITDDDL